MIAVEIKDHRDPLRSWFLSSALLLFWKKDNIQAMRITEALSHRFSFFTIDE